MYHHGEIYGYSIYTVSAIKLFLGNFTDDADKRTEAVITEKQKYSILTRTFDKDHNEVFKIYRGEVKDIATDAVRHDMGKEARMRCMIVKIDCSSKEASDVQYIPVADIVEVHEIDYEYKELVRTEYTIEEHPSKWEDINHEEAVVDFTHGQVALK